MERTGEKTKVGSSSVDRRFALKCLLFGIGGIAYAGADRILSVADARITAQTLHPDAASAEELAKAQETKTLGEKYRQWRRDRGYDGGPEREPEFAQASELVARQDKVYTDRDRVVSSSNKIRTGGQIVVAVVSVVVAASGLAGVSK